MEPTTLPRSRSPAERASAVSLNRWIKFYLDWQHAAYGSPVLINEPRQIFSRRSDLFWLRCQVYF